MDLYLSNDKEGIMHMYKTGWLICLIFVFAACGPETPPKKETDSVMSAGLEPERVIGIGRIEPELKVLDLHTEVPGIVIDIPIRLAEKVQKGETLLILSQELEKARLAQAEARIASQKSKIRSEQAALKAAEIRMKDAERSLKRTETLLENKAEAQAAYDRAQTAYDILQQEVLQLEAEVEVNQRMLNQYRADWRLARVEVERKTLSARSDGRLLTLDITIGSLVTPEKPFGTFAVDSPILARVEVDELFADLVRTGQQAVVRRMGETKPLSEGTVTFTGPALRKKSLFSEDVGDLEDRRVREVWVKLPENDSLLLGMRVECVIQIKK
jgi:HlyD family secretion protein